MLIDSMQEMIVFLDSFAAPTKAISLGRYSMFQLQLHENLEYCHNLFRQRSTCKQQRPH